MSCMCNLYPYLDLPQEVHQKLCKICSTILIPSITCKVRLRPRKKRSQVNNDKEKQNTRNVKNELVYICNICHQTSVSISAHHRPQQHTIQQDDSPPLLKKRSTPLTNAIVKQKFNFLHIMEDANARRDSAPGRLNTDFIPLNKTISNNDVSKMTIQTSANKGSGVNLIELEKMRKSQKRKSIDKPINGDNGPKKSNLFINSNISSLQSLQSVFSSKISGTCSGKL